MLAKPTKVDWNQFVVKNPDATVAFETLCYHLFCRRFKKVNGIRVDVNQPGIETEPIKNDKGELIGFQSKFFDRNLGDSSSVKQIKHSIAKAKKNHPELHSIIIYTHKSFGSANPNYKIEIETESKPLVIEWFLESHFKTALFQTLNLDLSLLYFGVGNELNFIRNSISSEMVEFFASNLHLKLPISDATGTLLKDPTLHIIQSSCNEFILTGNPGSGKSISMNHLFYELSGLAHRTTGAMQKQLIDQNAMPVLINLRNCTSDSIENIIRGRKADNNINGNTLNYIYLFDGLDELSDHAADQVLVYLKELKGKSDTAKMIFSCRSGNSNHFKAKTYFPGIVELKIAQLTQLHIDKYFEDRNAAEKVKMLAALRLTNNKLVAEIHDILLLKLLWETITSLNDQSTSIDLIGQKVGLLLADPKHKKDLERLNLLNPKPAQIVSLQKDLSYIWQTKFQFRFSLEELQRAVIEKFEFKDYCSVNDLVDYLIALFFENSYSDVIDGDSFIYQHRRYQEYFLALKLKDEYEKSPKILRELNVLANSDFFNDFFLPLLRQTYKRENNLAGFIELNLINVYMGDDDKWGADEPIYYHAPSFVQSVMMQPDLFFNELINDDRLDLKNKLTRRLENYDLNSLFKLFFSNTEQRELGDKLRDIWENDLAFLVKVASIAHKNNKIEYALDIKKKIGSIANAYRRSGFLKFAKKHQQYQHLQSPFWKSLEEYLYNSIVINGESLLKVYKSKISINFDDSSVETIDAYEEEGAEKLAKSFLRIGLQYRIDELIKLIPRFARYEMQALLSTVAELQFLPLFFQEKGLQIAIANALNLSSTENLLEADINLVFFKKLLNHKIEENEFALVEKLWNELKREDNGYLVKMKRLKQFVLSSWIKGMYTFSSFFEHSSKSDHNYYYEYGLYVALFADYLMVLEGKRQIQAIVRDFARYTRQFTSYANAFQYSSKEFSELWAAIFAVAGTGGSERQLAAILFSSNKNISRFDFYAKLSLLNPAKASDLLRKNDLIQLAEKNTAVEKDYYKYTENCFRFAALAANTDGRVAVNYLIKGLNEGLLRHGWRKDDFVSENLVDALAILWNNRWTTPNQLKSYTWRVFNLTLRVTEITDGKVTWRGPFNVIELIANHDVAMAVLLRDKLNEQVRGYHLAADISIIEGKIKSGYPWMEIESDIENLTHEYDYKGRSKSEYRLARLTCYILCATNFLFSDDEQSESFKKASDELILILEQSDNYIDWDRELGIERKLYSDLCNRYQIANAMPEPSEKKQERENTNTKSEAELLSELNLAGTPRELEAWYLNLSKYDSVKVTTLDSWVLIISKTYQVLNSIQILLSAMKRDIYPHSDYFGTNSKYYHLAVAAALNNINTRQETLEYLFSNSGHDGFINIMNSYEILKDETTCTFLFERFLKFADFLVN